MLTQSTADVGTGNGLPATPVLLAFAATVFLAGANAVGVSFTVRGLDPFWGATLRFTAAALIFWVIVLWRRAPLPEGRVRLGVLIYGILNFGLSYAFIYFAIREVTAGFTMVILALSPLLTLLFAVAHRLEPFRLRALLGALLSLAGIAVAAFGQTGSGAPLWAILLMVAGAASFSEATVVLKKLPPVSPLSANALGMSVAAVLLAVLSMLAGEAWVLPQMPATWAAVIYLVVFGSVLLFYLFVYVIQHWTASASSYALVLSPLVAVPLGAWLSGEEVTSGLLLGGVLVLAGVWVGAFSGHPAGKTAES